MLSAEAIRNEGRALSACDSGSHIGSLQAALCTSGKLDAISMQLRHHYDHLHSLIDRSWHDLEAKLEDLGLDEFSDPEGEGADALEEAENYFKIRRAELESLRCQLAKATVPPSHTAFEGLERLDSLYFWIISVMQELRWKFLIAEGLRTIPPGGETFDTAKELFQAIDG